MGVKKTLQTGRNRKAIRVGTKPIFMKKVLFLIALLFITTQLSFGQSRLPAAGDYSIGFDANPALKYIGNLFSGGNDISMEWQKQNTIMVSYMKSDDLAYRAGVGLSMASTKLSDTVSSSASDINLMAGMMKLRRGNRIMGYYGAEAGLGISSEKDKVGSTETKESGTAIMARGFIGAQYFIWEKVSIGAEYGLGLNLAGSKIGDAKVSSTNIGADNSGGQITLSVYF
jgi:hypothetical protein